MPKTTRPIVDRSFDCELRATDDSDGLNFEGYIAVFDTPTRIDSWEGKFDEQIMRGAFKKTIRERLPLMQWNHGKDPAVGQVPIGVYHEAREDQTGLWVSGRLHDNEKVRPIRDALTSKAISGASIRMQVLQEHIDDSGDVPLRSIKEIRLFEGGPVDFPAYTSTLVGVRDMCIDADDYTACLNCGCLADSDDLFCSRCGAQLPSMAVELDPDAGSEDVEAASNAPRANAPALTTRTSILVRRARAALALME